LLGEFNASFSHFSATFTIISACFSLFFSSLKTSAAALKRGRYDVDDRIANLHTKLNSAGEKLLEEMGEITSPVIDISELVENARNSVKGKSAIDALDTLAKFSKNFCCCIKIISSLM
jgi:phage-related minor tail protein